MTANIGSEDLNTFQWSNLSKDIVKKSFQKLESTFTGSELIAAILTEQNIENATKLINNFTVNDLITVSGYYRFHGDTLPKCKKELLDFLQQYPRLALNYPYSIGHTLNLINVGKRDKIPYLNWCFNYGGTINDSRDFEIDQQVFLYKSGVKQYKLSSKTIQYPEHFQTITQFRNTQ